MTTLFTIQPQENPNIEKGRGLLVEEQFVWRDAEKYHIRGVFGEADIQKVTGFNNGIQLFLLSYRMDVPYRIILKAFSPSILTVLQLKGQSVFSLEVNNTFRFVPFQYHILSVPVKKILLDIHENIEGKIVFITIEPEYFNDMILFYPWAKKFSKERRKVLAYLNQTEGLFMDRQMQAILSFILDHLQNASKTDPFTLGLAIKTFIGLALTGEQEPGRNQISGVNPQIVEIIDFLEENIDQFPGIKRLSRMAHLNTTTFKELFARAAGMPPEQFWNHHRLSMAHEMLSAQNKRPSEVAAILGYSSLHGFDKAFKKRFGVSPSMIFNGKK
jgi:AraC-type DNA-binding domain-containing proteins